MEMRYKMSAGLLSPQHIFNEFMCVYVRARGTHLSPALEPALIDNSIVENSMDASDGALSRNGSVSHPDTSLWVFGCWNIEIKPRNGRGRRLVELTNGC